MMSTLPIDYHDMAFGTDYDFATKNPCYHRHWATQEGASPFLLLNRSLPLTPEPHHSSSKTSSCIVPYLRSRWRKSLSSTL